MLDVELEILQKFDDLKSQLKQWGNIVDKTILEILTSASLIHEIKIYPKNRLKDDKGFLSKALWRNKNYEDPLLKMEDKVGTRIVLLKSDDIVPVATALLNYKGWDSKITKDLKGIIEGKPKEFNYQSFHIVVWPNSSKEFQKEIYPLLTCEIQIRTLLQHAFAEISHDSTYKGPYKNDADIIRALSKSMALMEATDDYFLHIFKMMTDITRKFNCYINELTTLFKRFKPDYKKEDFDFQLTEILFELLAAKDIPIDAVEELTVKNKSEIEEALANNKTLLFQQPIVLLIYYYLHNHRDFIKAKWPLSNETLKETFQGFGYSL